MSTLNAAEAYRRAGYAEKDAKVGGHTLLARPEIRAYVDEKLKAHRLTAEMEFARIMRELESVAYLDPAQLVGPDGKILPLDQMPEHVRRAIASIENEELWEGDGDGGRIQVGTLRKLKVCDKLRALEIRAKLADLVTDKLAGPDGGPLTIVIRKIAAEDST